MGQVDEISFPNVDSKTFQLIVDYMNTLLSPQCEGWSDQFFDKNLSNISSLLIASQYLEFDELSSNLSSYIAGKIESCQNPTEVFLISHSRFPLPSTSNAKISTNPPLISAPHLTGPLIPTTIDISEISINYLLPFFSRMRVPPIRGPPYSCARTSP